jgi:ataxia telangiectasia mutated family protein
MGTRTGEGEARGVEGQVQQLLHDAQDPDNLCRMYCGWAAWL